MDENEWVDALEAMWLAQLEAEADYIADMVAQASYQ
jgi:hypothetical protein